MTGSRRTTAAPDIEPAAACVAVRADLPGLDGHELSTRRATEIRAHLADCVECSAVAAEHRSVRRTLAELALVEATPPADLLPALLEQAAVSGARERAAVLGRGVVSGARPGVAAASAGVAAAAAAGLGVLAWRALRARRTTAVAESA